MVSLNFVKKLHRTDENILFEICARWEDKDCLRLDSDDVSITFSFHKSFD